MARKVTTDTAVAGRQRAIHESEATGTAPAGTADAEAKRRMRWFGISIETNHTDKRRERWQVLHWDQK
jgi:hypothetical protein